MLAQVPNYLTSKCTSREITLTTATNAHEKYTSEMSLNVEFNSTPQWDDINNIINLEEHNCVSNSVSDNANDSSSIEIENDDRNNVYVGVEVEVGIKKSNSRSFNN